MSYRISSCYYFNQLGLVTETEYHSVYGNRDFDLESVKYILDCWAFESVSVSNGIIRYPNGDKRYFWIEYNGRFCKKYRDGISFV